MTEGRRRRQLRRSTDRVEGPNGPIRLKWHKLRTDLEQAPFKLSNLALGWKLGASLEVDIIAAADGRFVVLHDATLGPSTTGRGRVASMTVAADGRASFTATAQGVADPDAPVLSLADLVARLRGHARGAIGKSAARLQGSRRSAARRKLHRRRGSRCRGSGERDRHRLALSRRSAPACRCNAGRTARLRSDACGVTRSGPCAETRATAPPHGAAARRRDAPICGSTR